MHAIALLFLGASIGIGVDATKLYKDLVKKNHTCAITNDANVYSCSALSDPTLVDSCCTETFGGLFLSTQFWDTNTGLESKGQLLPQDSWTLHGLWPDFCNGSYTQYCDADRQYDPNPSLTTNYPRPGTPVKPYNGTPVSEFITDFGRYDLLEYMNTYWINQGAPNVNFWAHEFSKHATCYSTFEVPCYGPKYRQHEEVIEFYETAISWYRKFPTWTWLSAAGITPSNTTTYSISSIQSALTKASGAIPYLGCGGTRYNATHANSTDNGYTVLNEVWYYMHIAGRPQDVGKYSPLNASLPSTSCATTPGAIKYNQRWNGSVRAIPKQPGYLDF